MRADELLDRVRARVFSPRVVSKCADWVEKNVVLRAEHGVPKKWEGPYRVDRTPYVRWVYNQFDSPEVDSLVGMKAHQLGFTEVLLNVVRWIVANALGDVLYCLNSDEEVRKLSRKRLRPSLEDCEATRAMIPADKNKFSLMVYSLISCTIELIGANTPEKLSQKSVAWVFMDELDKYKDRLGNESGPWQLGSDRLTAHDEGKQVGISTPTIESALTNQLYMEGTQHKFHVPCPACGFFQELIWDRMRFGHCQDTETSAWDLKRVQTETFYECGNPECAEEIREHEKPAMMARGKWVQTNDEALPQHVSFQISALYSPFKKMQWGRLAVMFLKSRRKVVDLQHFWNSILGLPWEVRKTSIRLEQVRKLIGPYYRGTLPIKPCFLTFAADRQGDVFKWSKVGFLPGGAAYVADFGEAATRTELLAEFDRAVDLVGEATPMLCHCGLVDSGFGAKTVYDLCIEHNRRHFAKRRPRFLFPCKGRAGGQVKATVWQTEVHRRGAKIPLYMYADPDYLSELYKDRIARQSVKLAFPMARPGNGAEARELEQYLAEFTNEQEVEERDALGGKVYRWKKIANPELSSDEAANDFGDTVKMALVLWDSVADRFVVETEPEPEPEPEPEAEVVPA